MRYRHIRYRYTMLYRSGPGRTIEGVLWRSERASVVLAQPEWRPATDVYETPAAFTVTIELAGMAEDDLEVQLFEDALVVEGRRLLPVCEESAVYHAVSIRQGPFRAEVPLPVSVDPDRVQARYERGLLLVTLPKLGREEGRT